MGYGIIYDRHDNDRVVCAQEGVLNILHCTLVPHILISVVIVI